MLPKSKAPMVMIDVPYNLYFANKETIHFPLHPQQTQEKSCMVSRINIKTSSKSMHHEPEGMQCTDYTTSTPLKEWPLPTPDFHYF